MNSHTDSIRRNTADLDQFKLIGWSVAGVVLCAVAGWLCLQVIANTAAVTRIEEREGAHFQQLHADLDEVKGDVKELLTRSREAATRDSANEVVHVAD